MRLAEQFLSELLSDPAEPLTERRITREIGGAKYFIAVSTVPEGEAVRVIVAVDKGGWSAFSPVATSALYE